MSLSDYFNNLDEFWKEFDDLTSLTECTCEAATRLNHHSKLMKLMQFLSGLYGSYNQVTSHIHLVEPFKSAFSIILVSNLIKAMDLCLILYLHLSLNVTTQKQ